MPSFFSLPRELRDQIYADWATYLALGPFYSNSCEVVYGRVASIRSTCRQMQKEFVELVPVPPHFFTLRLTPRRYVSKSVVFDFARLHLLSWCLDRPFHCSFLQNACRVRLSLSLSDWSQLLGSGSDSLTYWRHEVWEPCEDTFLDTTAADLCELSNLRHLDIVLPILDEGRECEHEVLQRMKKTLQSEMTCPWFTREKLISLRFVEATGTMYDQKWKVIEELFVQR